MRRIVNRGTIDAAYSGNEVVRVVGSTGRGNVFDGRGGGSQWALDDDSRRLEADSNLARDAVDDERVRAGALGFATLLVWSLL
jgi:hypothetical protein